MNRIAFVPVRGGSKSIPLKNVKNFCGRPLVFWTLLALENSSVDQVIVATDSSEIASVVQKFRFKKVRIFERSAENAADTSSTESVILELMGREKFRRADLFLLVQATNPFLKAEDIDQALLKMKKDKAQSLLSVVPIKRFFWTAAGRSVNYDFKKRPRRQDFKGALMENGAFYISSVGSILRSKNRLSGKIACYEMPDYSSFEIDEASDWVICENLFKVVMSDQIQLSLRKAVSQIKLFLTDVDGVLTDAGMYYSENGDELKRFSSHDGMALRFLQTRFGVKTGIITTENRKLNERRAEKLKLDFLRQGVQEKLEEVESICKHLGITMQEVAYIGDDVNDEKVLAKVGFAACPANAFSRIKKLPNVISMKKSGGHGAVREWAEYLFGEVEWSGFR